MQNIDLKPREEAPKSIFNPLAEDFTTEIRDDNNKITTYTIPSMKIATFPTYLASRIIEDLITKIKYERDINLLSQEAEEKIRKEVELDES